MPDSDAVRSRRKRLHAAGDCSLCRHDPARAAVPGVLPAPSGEPVDTRVSLEGLARRLEAAHERDPANALIARELRMTLATLSAADPDAFLDVS